MADVVVGYCRPTISCTFSMKNGSVENLKLRVLWGYTAKA